MTNASTPFALVVFGALLPAPLAAADACVCDSSQGCLDAARARRAHDLDAARSCYDRACTLGDAAACRELADTVAWDRAAADDLPLAIDAATRGCVGGNEQSCGILLAIAMHHDRADVLPPVERACAAGVLGICHQLGVAALDGTLPPASWARARRLLERACKGGLAESCMALAEKHTWGDPALGVAPSRPTARRLWLRACELGRPWACEKGARHERANERALLPARAEPFLRRGCASKKSAWSCAHLYDRKCEAGDGRACDALGEQVLGRCTRVCREWSAPPHHEGRVCKRWGSSCDLDFARAERPLQQALEEAVRACVDASDGPRVTVFAELVVLVTGRVQVERVRLHAANDERARVCVETRLSDTRTFEVPVKHRLRLRAVRREL